MSFDEESHYFALSQIHLEGDGAVEYWTRELGVDELSLRLAIAAVGRSETQVRDFLPSLLRDPAL